MCILFYINEEDKSNLYSYSIFYNFQEILNNWFLKPRTANFPNLIFIIHRNLYIKIIQLYRLKEYQIGWKILYHKLLCSKYQIFIYDSLISSKKYFIIIKTYLSNWRRSYILVIRHKYMNILFFENYVSKPYYNKFYYIVVTSWIQNWARKY